MIFFLWDFREVSQNALECFSEAGSAPIRSAVKFFFYIGVPKNFFSTSSKNIFSIDQKKSYIFFGKVEKIKKSKMFKESNYNFEISSNFWDFDFSILSNFFSKQFFDRSKNIFLKKVEKNPKYQYRSKFSLRIEWEHSQPLRTTLKDSMTLHLFG